jgi:hypothetical protein
MNEATSLCNIATTDNRTRIDPDVNNHPGQTISRNATRTTHLFSGSQQHVSVWRHLAADHCQYSDIYFKNWNPGGHGLITQHKNLSLFSTTQPDSHF